MKENKKIICLPLKRTMSKTNHLNSINLLENPLNENRDAVSAVITTPTAAFS